MTSEGSFKNFGISLNCKFGTDKAARHGGHRTAQPPAPAAPVGTCRYLHVPVGTCRYQHCRHGTDRRQPTGTPGCRRRLYVGFEAGSNQLPLSVAFMQAVGIISIPTMHHEVYRQCIMKYTEQPLLGTHTYTQSAQNI
jgi:hypothetical protein